jgi:GNAT superfamily N-acetyltransferase
MDPVGLLYVWQAGDPLPMLAPLAGFAAGPVEDARLVARLANISHHEARARIATGHRPYVARLDARPVAYGWCATRVAEIGELHLRFAIPARQRYLWDFGTLPAWRGCGVYPRLLQHILRREAGAGVATVWIGHDLANVASARGIERAGFRRLGTVARLPSGELGLVPFGDWPEGANSGARLLGLPVVSR